VLLTGLLNANEFRLLSDLRYLDLSRNYISRLPRDLGVHLTRLETLNLSANALSLLDASVFAAAQRLLVLDVSYNRIQVRRVVPSSSSLSSQHIISYHIGTIVRPLQENLDHRCITKVSQKLRHRGNHKNQQMLKA